MLNFIDVIGIGKCLMSSWFNLGWLYAFRNVSFSSRFSNLLEYKRSKYLLMIFWISLVFVMCSHFHLWFY
jgi:hypothetical protein